MAPATRTAKVSTRTPSKSGTKKPRGTVVADARGGKTTSECEAPAEGTPVPAMAMPEALHAYHDQVVGQLGAASILLGCTHEIWLASIEGRTPNADSDDLPVLAGERMRGAWELPRAIFNARTPAIDPALTLAHLRRDGRSIVVADTIASHWHDAALNACWAWGNRWREDLRASGGDVHRAARRFAQWWRRLEGDSERWPSPDRLRAEADLEYRAAVAEPPRGEALGGIHAAHKPGGYTKRELVEEAKTIRETFGSRTFDTYREKARIPAPEANGRGQQHRFTNAAIRALADAIEDGPDGRAIAKAWRQLIE